MINENVLYPCNNVNGLISSNCRPRFRPGFEVLRLCKLQHLVIMIIMSKLLQSDYTII